jgi:hypothetical protein
MAQVQLPECFEIILKVGENIFDDKNIIRATGPCSAVFRKAEDEVDETVAILGDAFYKVGCPSCNSAGTYEANGRKVNCKLCVGRGFHNYILSIEEPSPEDLEDTK